MLSKFLENWSTRAKRTAHVMTISLGIIIILWIATGANWLFALLIPAMFVASLSAFSDIGEKNE